MKNIKNKKIITIKSFLFLALVSPSSLLLASEESNIGFKNPLNNTNSDIFAIIQAVANFALQLLSAFVVLVIIYSGFLFVTAGGSDDKISKAKKFFMWAIIGGVVILAANALAGVICNTVIPFGAECNL